MQKSRIEWTDFSWNPIRGLCPVNCKTPDGKEYCYARRMYKRFGWDEEIRMVGYISSIKPRSLKKPSKIFVCSTIELFHPDIHPSYRELIFDTIEKCPQHTFQILTKFPQNIDRAMPDNVWLGVTVTGIEDESKLGELWQKKAKTKFVSFEPFLSPIHFSYLENLKKYVDWAIVGRLTGHGKKYNPKLYDLVQIRNATKILKIPLFLKDNLKEIWGDELIQELPE